MASENEASLLEIEPEAEPWF